MLHTRYTEEIDKDKLNRELNWKVNLAYAQTF